MRKLNTIQKRENLNEVFTADEVGPGNANHSYIITKAGKLMFDEQYITVDPDDIIAQIQFQCGPRKESDSISGVTNVDLLEIVRDQLKSFQSGKFASTYNLKALEHIELALMYLNRRTEDRIERNVLGTTDI